DLRVEIRCPGETPYFDKINVAYSRCGEEGSVETVKALTGLPINYLITINFRGFRRLVDKLGGVWMDVDRRYFNDQGGECDGCYAVINLQPGYQRLTGLKALDYVRFRHTDSDLHRNARQQQFVRAFKDQIRTNFSITKLPQVIEVITKHVEVGEGGGADVSARTVLRYGALAYTLPAGHVFQTRIEGLEGASDLTTATDNIERAIEQFVRPDAEAPQKATSVALGTKRRVKVIPPLETTVTVLNGNGITGSASSASYLLGRRSYAMVYPPNGVPANAPSFDFFETVVFFDRAREGASQAAKRATALFGSAETRPLTPAIRKLSNGALLVVVVGRTFHGRLAAAPVDQTPDRKKAEVAPRQDEALGLLRDVQPRVDFPLYVPKLIERTSRLSSAKPVRDYNMDPKGKHRTVRLVYRTGGNDYWGIQQTSWDKAPVLSAKNFSRTIGGRRYDLYYNGPRLHMIVMRTKRATYWVVNSLLDSLSNETMIAIAKSLRPIGVVSR
ncbi:MAG: LytR family transcriptional regulator, partial [Actinobacteria bacterium]|nr:LytR family transcriptional regulator [Actinomycetota bacterium]